MQTKKKMFEAMELEVLVKDAKDPETRKCSVARICSIGDMA